MTMARSAAALAVALLIGPMVWAPAALADREPTPQELPQIEQALRALGFTQWDDIEFENEVWETDDARGADGKEFDLKLRPDTFEVIEREVS